MDIDDIKIQEAVAQTEILRAPKQNLTTFGQPISITIWSPSPLIKSSSRILWKLLLEKAELSQKNPELLLPIICLPWKVLARMRAGTSII